jgi:general secretion pathway protein G
MQTASPQPPIPNRRRGFTLIEVLMVVAILSILMAFILPAIMRASRAAKIAQVNTEIGNLAAAIATFKQEFGIEPPSYITIYEAAADWNNDTRSRALISRMWPQYDFTTNFDLDGDGNLNESYTFNGAECLVFFLGGRLDSNGEPIGFSRNPAMPFSLSGGNRMNPFFQFEISRLVDTNGNGLLEYRDPLNATVVSPYVYFSSYGGSGYPIAIDSTPPSCGYLCSPPNLVDNSCDSYWYVTDNWSDASNSGLMVRPYYSTVPNITTATTDVATMTTQATGSRPQLPSSFQIISAGFDGQLGFGGDSDPALLMRRDLNNDGDFSDLFEDRDVERDNITNFSKGLLAP